MPSTTDDCDPLAPPCKHDFLNICYEYWPCANEGNHDSYPTDIVDVFEHNHFNHTDPHEELPEGGDDAKEGTTERSSGEKTTSGNPNTGSGVEEPCEDKPRGDDTRTPIEGAPDKT